MDAVTLSLIGLAAGVAIAYGITGLHGPPSQMRALFKSIPLFLLTLAAAHSGAPALLIAAFGFCFLGDWFLAFEGEIHFIAGLVSFLLAHLAYSGLFLSGIDPAAVTPDTELLILGTVMLAAIAIVNLQLAPHAGQMRIPVFVYSVVIALMAISARIGGAGAIVQTGIAMFIVSDIVLAREKFLPDGTAWWDRNSRSLVWWLYVSGQLLIAAGLLA